MPDEETPSRHILVSGIVSARDKKPYVQLATENGLVGQFSMSEARQVAHDLIITASRAEADAMLLKFFEKAEFPEGAGAALMVDFRDFRAELDAESAIRGDE